MNFGTPLTSVATKALLLGSGELGKEVALELQRYGVEVIATPTLVELEKEGYRVIPTANAAFLTMNREAIRRMAAEEFGLPTDENTEKAVAKAMKAFDQLKVAGELKLV